MYTYAHLKSLEEEGNGIEIRLQRSRSAVLPRGYLRFQDQAEQADETTLRFLFSDDQLQLAEAGQESDFELHYRFKPEVRKNGWNPGLGSHGRFQIRAVPVLGPRDDERGSDRSSLLLRSHRSPASIT